MIKWLSDEVRNSFLSIDGCSCGHIWDISDGVSKTGCGKLDCRESELHKPTNPKAPNNDEKYCLKENFILDDVGKRLWQNNIHPTTFNGNRKLRLVTYYVRELQYHHCTWWIKGSGMELKRTEIHHLQKKQLLSWQRNQLFPWLKKQLFIL